VSQSSCEIEELALRMAVLSTFGYILQQWRNSGWHDPAEIGPVARLRGRRDLSRGWTAALTVELRLLPTGL